MEVGKESRVARYFFWSLGVWLSFDKYAEEAYTLRGVSEARERGTDLCSMMRVMCIYAPCVIVAQVAFYVSGLAALVGVPIYLYGFRWWGGAVLRFFFGVAALVLAFVLLYVIFAVNDMVSYKMREMRTRKTEEKNRDGIDKLLKEWVRAKKQKVCPMITFVGREE